MGRRYRHCHARLSAWAILALVCIPLAAPPPVAAQGGPPAAAFTNPLALRTPAGAAVESCADPAIIHSQRPGDASWYLYCTTDPLNTRDRLPDGSLNYHLIPTLRSADLVHWTYAGDAFPARPPWVAPAAYLWAPDIQYFNDRYYLYYTATETTLPGGGSAIGVATSASPAGPWADSGAPVVAPTPAPCCADSRRWTFDPAVVADTDGRRYLFFGSFFGGIAARRLSADGLRTDPASERPITVANRYEGTSIVRHGQYWYLFASATSCCNGPLTGYAVFVGRSASLLGPYADREDVSLLDGRAGGTPVLTASGNRWVGPGHNAVFTDSAGRDWFLYHAIARDDPYFAGTDVTKRPPLMDPLDWADGWPMVRGGLGPSDTPQPAPAARTGQPSPRATERRPDDALGTIDATATDEFSGGLGPRWSWVRPPPPGSYGVAGGALRMETQAGDLFERGNTAPVLSEPAPLADYTVEVRVRLDVPAQGCCDTFVQAGLVIYRDDDNYLKLVHTARFETRQTEFAKEVYPVPPGYPRYGNTVVGPPAEWTYLRIVKRTRQNDETYTAYTSRDGVRWVRGGTWTHALGREARIGLVAMGGAGYRAQFDYVHVYTIPAPYINPRLGSG